MYKCKICGKKYKDLACLYNHLESKHADVIPQNMSVQQFYYYTKTGKMNGNCVMCKHPTTWNMNTNKYNRFCGDPKCKAKYVEIMKGRMIAKYGKAHLLNDPNKQREMLANRSISGTYEWSDGKHKTTYTGSYELDFLKTLDNFFEWDPADISMPSPHTYTYEYEGERKFYIPDVFIHSLDLEIEIKDGGDNPNRHHKIQDVDKVKEKLKDEVLTSQRNFHYVKITNKNYSNFFDFLKEVKDGFEKYGDDKKIPRIFKTEDIRTKGDYVKESYEELDVLEEKFEPDKFLIWFDKPIDKLLNRKIRLYHSSVNGHSINSEWNVGDTINPMSINTGATKYSDVRLSLYFWDNPEYAEQWGVTRTLTYEIDDEYFYSSGTHSHKSLISLPQGMTPDELITHILKKKPSYTLYEAETNVKRLEMGPVLNLKEYTVSEPIKILKKVKVEITKEMILKYCTIVNGNEFADYITALEKDIISNMKKYFARGCLVFMLNKISGGRDKYRGFIWRDLIDGKITNYKDLANYKHRINKSLKANSPYLLESLLNIDIIEEGFARDVVGKIDEFNKKSFRESDLLLSLRYDLVKGSPKELQEFLLHLIKGAKYKDDLIYVNELVGRSETYYYNLLKKRPEIKGEYNDYHNWTYTGMRKEMKDKLKKIEESVEEFDLLEEKFEPDKFLVWFDKPVKKLVGGKLRVYHGSSDLIEADEITPISFNVGATKHSDPRWSTYVWDNKEDAMKWASAWEVSNYHRETLYIGHNGKTMLGKPEGIEDKAFVKELINKMSKARFYIYECEVDIKDLEIGSCPSIKEYTISKPIKVLKRYDYTLNKEIVRRCFNILPVDEVIKFRDENRGVKHLKLHRNFILNHVLDNTRDSYRAIMRTDLQQGNIKVGDDLSGYKDSINHHVKRDTYGLKESYITDIMEESSISMAQLNLYLQNQYEEEMKHYLDTYKQYYEIMRKEKPHAVKNLNEDIKRAIIFIDGLASKGVENNLVQFAREELGSIVNIPKRGNAVKIHESTDVLNIKLIYENSNARGLFGLADTKSQLVFNNEFIVKRDKMGNHCSVSILEETMNSDNIIEFEIKFNDLLDFDNYLKENMNEGISLNTMFNFRDEEYKFIKEACLKIFGSYPESINKK